MRRVAHVQRVGGRSPVVNRQVPLLLVGIAVGLLAAVRKMPRSGWGGKLNFTAALRVGRLPLRRAARLIFTALFHFCWRRNGASGLRGS